MTTRKLARVAFVPSDYREPVVLGWLGDLGFQPDSPVQNREGFLIRVRANQDTPTMPPAKPDDSEKL